MRSDARKRLAEQEEAVAALVRELLEELRDRSFEVRAVFEVEAER